MSHTPGPWKVSGLGYVVARDPRETIICQPLGSIANPEVAADMRLIAAAPDLLATLTRIVETWETGGTVSDVGNEIGNARAAIAKAES